MHGKNLSKYPPPPPNLFRDPNKGIDKTSPDLVLPGSWNHQLISNNESVIFLGGNIDVDDIKKFLNIFEKHRIKVVVGSSSISGGVNPEERLRWENIFLRRSELNGCVILGYSSTLSLRDGIQLGTRIAPQNPYNQLHTMRRVLIWRVPGLNDDIIKNYVQIYNKNTPILTSIKECCEKAIGVALHNQPVEA